LALPPRELAETLATGKAEAVAIKHQNALVIGADTFVELDGAVLGKPYVAERAMDMLRQLSGKSHNILTGYCIIDTKNGMIHSGVETTRVTFRQLTEQEIADYVASGEPLLAAGAYMIQSGAAGFVSEIEGDYDNIVGLPVAKITEELRAFGIPQ